MQGFATGDVLRERLRTTFDLIEKDSSLSSKAIDDKVSELRKTFTPSLGERLGRVMLKSSRPLFDQRMAELKAELGDFQERVRNELQTKLNDSRDLVVNHYLPLVTANPPDALVARVNPLTDDAIKRWLERELDKAFPTAEKMVEEMRLEAQFKDVTWETLNDPDFGKALRKAFPDMNWDKPFDEYKAAAAPSALSPAEQALKDIMDFVLDDEELEENG